MSDASVTVPAEHERHRSCWMAWPHLAEEWVDLRAAQAEYRQLVEAVAETEPVDLIVDPSAEAPSLAGANVRIARMPVGDAWTRDSLPVMAVDANGELALVFRFDGWGGKYDMPGDSDLSPRVADHFGLRSRNHQYVFEGGGIEVDGEGTVLTTESWLRRLAARSGTTPDAEAERMQRALGAERLLRVEAMLANDHTDGHIDTLARFVRPGVVVTMGAEGNDPNGAMLLALQEQLQDLTDARGRRLEVHVIPSPGAIFDNEDQVLAASYANYYLANDQVIVPTYGVAADAEAVRLLERLFPDRRVRGLGARAIIEGGGAFHCMTQQRPA